ncbi:MAG: J domain-containing protein [Bacteroidota bacterium]
MSTIEILFNFICTVSQDFDTVISEIDLDSLVETVRQNSTVEESDKPGRRYYFLSVPLFLIILGSMIYLSFGPTQSWAKGRFPMQLKYKEENLFEAYICLGIVLFKKDSGELLEKAKYLSSFLKNKFRGLKNNNYEHVINTIKLQVSEESVLNWLKKKMPQEERIQIIDFLVSLIFINHEISLPEQKMLFRVVDELLIPRNEVNAILSIRFKIYEEKKKAESKTVIYNSVSLKTTYLKFFGLESDSTFLDVKKVYRIFAKKFHPDLFINMGESDKIMAHERFTEINNAYEFLEKSMN